MRGACVSRLQRPRSPRWSARSRQWIAPVKGRRRHGDPRADSVLARRAVHCRRRRDRDSHPRVSGGISHARAANAYARARCAPRRPLVPNGLAREPLRNRCAPRAAMQYSSPSQDTAQGVGEEARGRLDRDLHTAEQRARDRRTDRPGAQLPRPAGGLSHPRAGVPRLEPAHAGDGVREASGSRRPASARVRSIRRAWRRAS